MKNSTRVSFLTLTALTVMTLTSVGRAAINVIVPGGNAATEGDTDNGFPFNIAHFGVTSQRYQQVYDASAFSAFFGPHLVTDILFRPDLNLGQAAAFSSTLTNIQIDLSTTSKGVDGLSTNFADNVGVDDTVVHSGTLSLSSAFTGSGPKDFDILIHLTTPFTYDHSAGNLLLDVRNFSGGTTTQFDAVNSTDSVSRVFSTGVGDAAGTADTLGLVTKFVFDGAVPSAVPLPAAFPAGMALLGALGLSKRLRRKA